MVENMTCVTPGTEQDASHRAAGPSGLLNARIALLVQGVGDVMQAVAAEEEFDNRHTEGYLATAVLLIAVDEHSKRRAGGGL